MTKNELKELIKQTQNYGFNIVKNFDDNKFDHYKSLLATIIINSEKLLNNSDEFTLKLIENIKYEKIENFKLNLLEKLFYFKKYQYRFSENIITNKMDHVKKRFILEMNERIINLVQMV